MSLKGADRWKAVHTAVKRGKPPPAFDTRPESARTKLVGEVLLDRASYVDDNRSAVFSEAPPRIAQMLTDDGEEPRVRRVRRAASTNVGRTPLGTKLGSPPPLSQEAQYRLKFETAIFEGKAVAGWDKLDTKAKLAKIAEKMGIKSWMVGMFLSQNRDLCEQCGIQDL